MAQAPTPGAHKARVTWPMVLVWLTTAAALVPVVLSDLGTLHLPAWVSVAGVVFVHVVGNLNHSPLATPGGGLPVDNAKP